MFVPDKDILNEALVRHPHRLFLSSSLKVFTKGESFRVAELAAAAPSATAYFGSKKCND